MGCNCGKRKPKPTKNEYVAITASGVRQEYGSRLEAEAALRKAKQDGRVIPLR